ncbi:MAG: rhombosortase [Xanthomonadales bacterium]|nr:rhombosortase [Xanthomonadales bacterium]
MFESSALLGGELWRLVTAHFTHLSTSHLAWNTATFLVLLLWSSKLGKLDESLEFVAVAAPALSVLLLLAGIDWYLGLSGVLHGLLVLLLLQSTAVIKWPGIALLVVKLWLQPRFDGVSTVQQSLPVLHEAHWLGVALALGYCLLRRPGLQLS